MTIVLPRRAYSAQRILRMPKRKLLYCFDTVVLSNFAFAGRLDVLAARYGKQLAVTREVLDEVTDGVVAGYVQLRAIETAVADGKFGNVNQISASAERDTYRELLRVLAPGEASCIALAKTCGGIVVTDDKTARECCLERGVKFTGTIGILKACCIDMVLSEDEADAILESMIDAGYYSPVKRIGDLM